MALDLDTSQIRDWRSIVTLIVFVLTNLNVLFPFHIPFYLPRQLVDGIRDVLSALRIISPREERSHHDPSDGKVKRFVRFRFPMNFVTAPLIADLFLLAILAIGRQEVHDGTIGAENISPIDIMAFFITLAYIAISIDASGLIRYLAFKVLQLGGKVGHRLFFFLYAFFFGLGSFIGNDPIILSGTAFLAYMTRVSSNIIHPRAWIHTQFAVANIASAILVSSNPTNLVLAGAFGIRFIDYTAAMIVPVVLTAIFLFPFLLYIVFANEDLIPLEIKMHELPEAARAKKPVNPNIPHARGTAEEEENDPASGETGKLLSLEEIMNPFLDKGGAMFGAVIMAVTLLTLLILNAIPGVAQKGLQVYWVTLPGAFIMFCWDLGFGWMHRDETREIARRGRQEVERARAERALREEQELRLGGLETEAQDSYEMTSTDSPKVEAKGDRGVTDHAGETPDPDGTFLPASSVVADSPAAASVPPLPSVVLASGDADLLGEKPGGHPTGLAHENSSGGMDEKKREMDIERRVSREMAPKSLPGRTTLTSLAADTYRWSQETFPTATAVLGHLPFALIPFAFSMFVLVQALVTKGWVPVFAYGWDHWVNKTGTIGSIGGMAFLSVILCNFAGTNIGTTILLCRVIQSWLEIHKQSGDPISNRTFWATVYSMALGVNYGAFSTAFSASLAGLLWRDILARKHIHVRGLEFARVNLPIIAIAMTIGCAVLVGEVYIVRDEAPYPGSLP